MAKVLYGALAILLSGGGAGLLTLNKVASDAKTQRTQIMQTTWTLRDMKKWTVDFQQANPKVKVPDPLEALWKTSEAFDED